MTELATQTVDQEPQAVAEPTAPVTDARAEDLDTLLSQFEKDTKPPQPNPLPEPPKVAVPQVDPQEFAQFKTEFARMQLEKELAPVRDRIRGDIPKEVFSDDELTDLLNGRAARDQRLRSAWENRSVSPNAWSKIEKALSAELSAKFKKLPDPQATEDVAAVTAAVRGASQRPPADKAPNFASMSNGEYRKSVKEKYGFDPGI